MRRERDERLWLASQLSYILAAYMNVENSVRFPEYIFSIKRGKDLSCS